MKIDYFPNTLEIKNVRVDFMKPDAKCSVCGEVIYLESMADEGIKDYWYTLDGFIRHHNNVCKADTPIRIPLPKLEKPFKF